MPNQYKGTQRPCIEVIGPSIAYVPLTRGLYALIDSDYATIANLHSWGAAKGWKSNFYPSRGTHKNKTIRLHSSIIEVPKGLFVDHINRNPLDNRRCNLRLCTQAQNARNIGKRSVNTSGYPNVFFHKKTGKYLARVIFEGKAYSLGYSDDPQYLSALATQKRKELHGQFAA